MSLERLAGSFPSCCWHPAGDADARVLDGAVVVRVNGAEVWRQSAGPMRWLAMAAKLDGTVWVLGAAEVDGIDRAFLITSAGVTNLGVPSYGTRCVRLAVVSKRFVAYVCDSPYSWLRIDLENGQRDRYDNPFPDGTVAGMRGLENGVPLWCESTSGGYVEEHGLRFPQTADGVTVGQIAGPDTIGAYHDGVTSEVIPGQCYESEHVVNAAGLHRICARTSTGSAFISCPPWPAAVEPPQTTVPEFGRSPFPVGLALFADDAGPTVCSVEGSKPPYVSHERTPFAFSTVNGSDYNPSGTRALAAEHGIVELYYRDGRPIDVAEMPYRDADAWAGVYTYPHVSMATIESATRRLISAGIHCAFVVPVYCQWHTDGSYTWPEQVIVDRLHDVWALGVVLGVTAQIGFAKRRVYNGAVVDGLEYWPAIAESWARMKTASGAWQTFPVRSGSPTPIPPEPPTPIPPTPEPVSSGSIWPYYKEFWQ